MPLEAICKPAPTGLRRFIGTFTGRSLRRTFAEDHGPPPKRTRPTAVADDTAQPHPTVSPGVPSDAASFNHQPTSRNAQHLKPNLRGG